MNTVKDLIEQLNNLLEPRGWKKLSCGFGTGTCFRSEPFDPKEQNECYYCSQITIRCYNDGVVTFGIDRSLDENPEGNPMFTDPKAAYDFITANLDNLAEKVKTNGLIIYK
jgi:hypothetical protein